MHLVDCSTGLASWDNEGELVLVIQVQENYLADQFSFHPFPDPEEHSCLHFKVDISPKNRITRKTHRPRKVK